MLCLGPGLLSTVCFLFVMFPVFLPDMVERESFRNIYTADQLQLDI